MPGELAIVAPAAGDGDRMVEAFAARLKDAVDLDMVRTDLAGVVTRALEPTHVSVWTARDSWLS